MQHGTFLHNSAYISIERLVDFHENFAIDVLPAVKEVFIKFWKSSESGLMIRLRTQEPPWRIEVCALRVLLFCYVVSGVIAYPASSFSFFFVILLVTRDAQCISRTTQIIFY